MFSVYKFSIWIGWNDVENEFVMECYVMCSRPAQSST